MLAARRRSGVAAVVLAAMVAVAACGTGSGTEVRHGGDQAPVDPAAAEAASLPLLSLAVDLEQALAEANPGTDLTVAPLPVALSLAQARLGAGGTTAAELDRVLHVPPGAGEPDRTWSGLSSARRILATRNGDRTSPTGRSGSVSLDLAQALWVQKATQLEDRWLDDLATTFGTGVRSADFRSDPETARRAVNDWARAATRGHIDQLAARGSVAATTRLLATGAAYLKAPWAEPFAETDTRLASFRRLDGSTARVAMMRDPDREDALYGAGDGWIAVDLPYLGRELWMTVVMPEVGRFGDVERGLSGEGLRALVDSLEPARVDVSLPRFAFTTDMPRTDALRAVGLVDATDPSRADFGGVTEEPMGLAGAIEQTYLSVAEQGTEAVATDPRPPATTTSTATTSTTTGGASTGGPATTVPAAPTRAATTVVEVDRPFLVLVRDRQSGTPVFYGRVLSPNG